MSLISRRDFAAALAGSAVVARLPDWIISAREPASRSIAATEIVRRIQQNIGVDWKPDTVDTIKAGDASTAVTGVVTTAMATLSVLQQAVKAGANLIITCEPTFYGKADARIPPADRGARRGGAGGGGGPVQPQDAVFTAKNEFIARNNLVVFRLSDHWQLRRPDPFAQGIAVALGWTKYQSPVEPHRFDPPELRLDALAAELKARLGARGGIRVIGDPGTSVRRVGLLPGVTPLQASLRTLPNLDVIVAGEVREWESVEYARDAVFSGQRKGLILVGRVVSEEPGMNFCAGWLRTFVPEVPVSHISAGDPYWSPAL